LTSVYSWTNNPNPKEKIMKHTPYDTGKVKIGLLYTPPPPTPTPEDDWAQSILLGDRQGLSDLEATTLGSLIAIALITIVMLTLGGNYA
jgi:hypothetical protein